MEEEEEINQVAAQDRANEVVNQEGTEYDIRVDGHVTRFGRMSQPPTLYPDTSNVQIGDKERKWIKPYCYDDASMVEKLSPGMLYHETHLLEDVIEEVINACEALELVQR